MQFACRQIKCVVWLILGSIVTDCNDDDQNLDLELLCFEESNYSIMVGYDNGCNNVNRSILNWLQREYLSRNFFLTELDDIVANVSINKEDWVWVLMRLTDFDNHFSRLEYEIPIDRILDCTCMHASGYDIFLVILKVRILFSQTNLSKNWNIFPWMLKNGIPHPHPTPRVIYWAILPFKLLYLIQICTGHGKKKHYNKLKHYN